MTLADGRPRFRAQWALGRGAWEPTASSAPPEMAPSSPDQLYLYIELELPPHTFRGNCARIQTFGQSQTRSVTKG